MEDKDFEEDTLRDKAEVLKNAGNEAYSKKDFAKAISFYTEGIKIQCMDKELLSKLYNNRSTVYFYLENYHDCLNDVKAATALQPFYVKAIIRGARACLKLKQFEEAIIWCDKGLAFDKDNQEVLEIKSCSIKEHENLSKQGGSEEAKEEDDSGNNPKSLDCTLTAETGKNAGNNAFLKDDFVTAINLYTEGIEVKCKDEDLNAKLYNNRASAHYHLGNFQDCLGDVKAATALQPSYLKAIIRGANACLKLKQFQEAIIWCDKGLTIDKDNQDLLQIKTYSIKEREKVSKQGGDKEAIDEGESGTNPKSLDCTLIAETSKNAGNDAFHKDDFVKAINLYTEGVEVKCEDEDLNAKLYNNRASAHYHLENYHDCLSDVKAATALQPFYLKAIIRGAKTCLKLKQLEEAIIWCDKGLAIDKDNQNLLEIKTCSVVEREKILTREGDKAAKEEGNSRTNQASLDSMAETHKNAGNDAFLKRHLVKAINLYTEGIKVKCKDEDLNAKLYNNRASAHYHLEKYHDCLSDVKAATALQPSYLKAIIRGAKTCLKLKQFEEAIIWCDKGLSIDKSNKTLLEIRRLSVNMECRLSDKRKEIKNNPETTSATETVYSSSLSTWKLFHMPEELPKFVKDKAIKGHLYSSLGDAFRSRCEYKKAIEYHKLALGIARDLNDKVEEGLACRKLGDDLQKVCSFNKAIEYHRIALRIFIDLKDKAGEGYAYCSLGHGFRALYHHKQAIEYYKRCLSVAKELGERGLEGAAYSSLGHAFDELSDYKTAETYHYQHLNIAKSLNDMSGERTAYASLGSVFGSLGDFKKSLDHFNCAINIAKKMGDKEALMKTYAGLGKAFEHLGNLKKAEEYTNLHLNLAKEIGNKCEEGGAYCNLGHIFSRLGNLKKSIECYNRQLKIAKDFRDSMAEGAALGGLGLVFDRLGHFEKAIDYHKQHLRIAETIEDKDGEAIAYGNLGNAYLSLESFNKALGSFEHRLRIAKDLGDKAGEGRAYGHLGNTYQHLGDYEKAMDYYNRRLRIAQGLGDKAGEGAACGYLGSISLLLGRCTIAIGWNEKRLRIAEHLGDKDMEGKAYSDLGRCFEMLKSFSKALENYQASVKVFNQMRSLLQSQDEWKIGFRNECNYAYTGLCRVLLKQEKIGEALVAAEEGRAQSLADLMTSQYGFHEAQTEGKRLDEEEFGMLNKTSSSTIFLSVSENKINIWLVLKEKPVVHRQKTLCHYFSKNAAAETLHSLIQVAYENNDVRANVSCENRSLDVLRENRYAVERSSKKCSQQILQEDNLPLAALYSYVIAPMLALIEGDELIIVPDGPLWLAPFAALLDPFSKYLCESFKVRLIPSLTSLKIIAHCPEFHSSSGALVVGDPDMSEVTNSQGDQLEPLPFARQEAQMIGQILNTAPLTGNLATKCKVLKQISSVAVVHIAAHGRMETGEIALSPNPERQSQSPAEEDYMLTMADVMSVKLRAKLVVLSCCHSGRGEIKAEGVVGIARAFIGAGARSVLVSLWAIDDEATLEFMRNFYHNLVKGRSASESLNRAMKCLRESEKFGDLKYWAPFTLIGDDVTLDKQGEIRVS